MADLLTEELNDNLENTEELHTELCEEIIVDEPKIQYNKNGKVKKPRTPAQLAALANARKIWSEKQSGVVAKKREALIETIELASKAKIEKNKKIIARQEELATQRINRVNKIPLSTELPKPDIDVVDEVEPAPDPEIDPEKGSKEAKPKKIKKKKPVVVVEQNSDSETDIDNENVIFIKRRARKKIIEEKTAPVIPYFVQPPTAFSRNYFFNSNAMQ